MINFCFAAGDDELANGTCDEEVRNPERNMKIFWEKVELHNHSAGLLAPGTFWNTSWHLHYKYLCSHNLSLHLIYWVTDECVSNQFACRNCVNLSTRYAIYWIMISQPGFTNPNPLRPGYNWAPWICPSAARSDGQVLNSEALKASQESEEAADSDSQSQHSDTEEVSEELLMELLCECKVTIRLFF